MPKIIKRWLKCPSCGYTVPYHVEKMFCPNCRGVFSTVFEVEKE